MSNLQQQLKQVADARRRELLLFMFDQTKGLVQTGPFKGMTIVPFFSWGDGDSPAKLLGVYEDELHPAIEHAIAANPDLVLNIGCAEGYYSVGVARRLPNATNIAVDINPSAVDICSKNFQVNGVTKYECLLRPTTAIWLGKTLSKGQAPLLVMDCEGAELTLLEPTEAPELATATVLVECHDCVTPGITDAIKQRFESTHNIVSIEQKFKDPYQFDFLKQLSDCDKWALVHEGRPNAMTWLYMTPKVAQ
jgi:hypothetical protein